MRLLPLVALAACASPSRPIEHVRFANTAPVQAVDDRRDTPKTPGERVFHRYLLHFDSYYIRARRGLALERHRRARGTSALDDVPDSTWFTNRIGKRRMTPDEIRRGPGPESPEQHLPWRIESLKTGGTQVGFVVEDARGVKFLLKFDPPDAPEVETSADVITARLMWAAGYNVPSDHIVFFRRADLQIAPEATIKGTQQPVDAELVDKLLARARIRPGADGKIRGIASVLVPGKPLGGAPRMGVREDDPNDRIPHELRRDIRGRAAIAAWLGDNDLREDNTLDVYRADPADPRIHYVVHYLLDFGNSLGADAALANQPNLGYEYGIDPARMLSSLFTFGLIERAWETLEPSHIRGVGMFDAEHYDPEHWKPNTPAHLPVIWADRFDKYWGSKILIRFTRDQLAAAVSAARFSDPRAAPYLVDTLIARQRKTAWHWFRQVNPIDEFAVDDDRVCFTDLALHYRLETAPTRFSITTHDAAARVIGRSSTAPDRVGRACIVPRLSSSKDSYTILVVESSRGMPGTQIHLATDPISRRMRVIGIHRL